MEKLSKINNKSIIKNINNTILIVIFSVLSISCIHSKFEKPPKFNYRYFEGIPNIPARMHYVLSLGDLKLNADSLYCKMYDNECIIINGKTTLFTYYLSEGSDVKNLIPYNYAKGEFLEGKYHGIWEYYDKEGKIIKIERWDNGKLMYNE